MDNALIEPNITAPEPRKALTAGAVVFFLLAVLGIVGLIVLAQVIVWNLEQTAIADGSLDTLANAGKIWFLIQALVVAGLCGIGVAVSKSAFRSVYRSWLLAALLTLPAWVLQFLGPNQDQLGAALQILLAGAAGVVALLINRRGLRDDGRARLALALVPLGIWPFLLWGALGSGTDIILNVLVGLAIGLLVAGLVVTPTRNFLLDGLGILVLLTIVGTALGYDGGQLLLLIVLPAFGFALTFFAPSVLATMLVAGLFAAAPLVFIDPTELTIVLGDLLPWAMKAAFAMAGLGLLVGVLAWIVLRATRGAGSDDERVRRFPLYPAIATWAAAALLYAFLGLHGFAGDRLFVVMKEQADLSKAPSMTNLTARRTYVYKTLTEEANRSQAGLRQTLDRFGIHYTPYYLVNSLEVDGSALVRLYLQSRPEVDRVIASPRLRPIPSLGSPMEGSADRIFENPGWNIKMIGADQVWAAFDARGKGVVIGQSDSGVDGKHPALRDSYRGNNVGNDYNWYDPWTGSISPTDHGGHGTHTLGTIVGAGGIGIAPEAQWMACVNMERNLGNPPFYLRCMQFMLAPFPQAGDPLKDGDPSKAADVLNNSWGCPTIEGCDPQSLRPAVDALRAAGIFVVVSTGNDGPRCGTVSNPPAIYDSVLSVGAIDRFGNMAQFSSRGPVGFDGSGRIKPDLSAPGVQVFSSLPGGTYGALQGTSMAGPHVVGAVALLWSADPTLKGNIDRTEQILLQTAKPYTGQKPPDECFTGSKPNNAYGYGILDAYAAVKMALGK